MKREWHFRKSWKILNIKASFNDSFQNNFFFLLQLMLDMGRSFFFLNSLFTTRLVKVFFICSADLIMGFIIEFSIQGFKCDLIKSMGVRCGSLRPLNKSSSANAPPEKVIVSCLQRTNYSRLKTRSWHQLYGQEYVPFKLVMWSFP